LRPNREANVFAAEVLIDDRHILEVLEMVGSSECSWDYSIDMPAREFGVDARLVLIKLEMLERRGMALGCCVE
jgi:Zn-dependent peptidase ImmA (M78 family)